MATRKQAREAVIQILYARELGNERAIEQAEYFLNEQKIRNKQQEFALSLLHGVCSREHEIVQVMNVFLKTWDIGRLGVIEKNILKLGIYELQQTNTQQAVVINEAIELTKSFNVQDAFRLVNGVLDSVAKTDSETLANLTQEYEQAHINKQLANQQKLSQQEMSQKPNRERIASKKSHPRDNVKKAKQKTFKAGAENIQKRTNPKHIKSVKLTTRNNQQKIRQKENKDEKDDAPPKNRYSKNYAPSTTKRNNLGKNGSKKDFNATQGYTTKK